MQYRPYFFFRRFFWCRSDAEEHQTPAAVRKEWWVLPLHLFDLLTGGTYVPENFVANQRAYREYDTKEAAYSDLQQAAQVLYEQKLLPVQYQNPFEIASIPVDSAESAW